VKPDASQFMLREIDARIAKRRKPLDFKTEHILIKVRPRINAGLDLGAVDAALLTETWERMTDAPRMKYGNYVRPL